MNERSRNDVTANMISQSGCLNTMKPVTTHDDSDRPMSRSRREKKHTLSNPLYDLKYVGMLELVMVLSITMLSISNALLINKTDLKACCSFNFI